MISCSHDVCHGTDKNSAQVHRSRRTTPNYTLRARERLNHRQEVTSYSGPLGVPPSGSDTLRSSGSLCGKSSMSGASGARSGMSGSRKKQMEIYERREVYSFSLKRPQLKRRHTSLESASSAIQPVVARPELSATLQRVKAETSKKAGKPSNEPVMPTYEGVRSYTHEPAIEMHHPLQVSPHYCPGVVCGRG
ncbi:unnamed protein product [Protopolystoma xenopodis]|uniref:Uncharacterized protein n=1 Tax=Protopolystoma xenopodis TaxID=117903 RepID=A0A448XL22_9PLAT|nr:unnamed protein product [Protopolystoma xenopodis]